MSKVFIEYLRPKTPGDNTLEKLSQIDEFGVHLITKSAEDADLILFVKFTGGGPFFNTLWHPLYRRYRQKCRVFCSGDKPIYLMPGVYTSLEKNAYDPNRCVSFHYLHGPQNPFILDDRIEEPAQTLYSFLGSSGTHRVRTKLFGSLPTNPFVKDTLVLREKVQGISDSEKRQSARLDFRKTYADSLYAAKFILCPRGFGTASFRIFEAMRCGRVPVIIADDWVEPKGPDWSSCSVRVPEKEVSNTHKILLQHALSAEQMGKVARSEWERWFSPEVSFHRLVETAELLQPRNETKVKRLRNVCKGLSLGSLKLYTKELLAQTK